MKLGENLSIDRVFWKHCFTSAVFVLDEKKRKKEKREEIRKGKLRDTSIRPFIVEAALSRQVEPNYKNSSVARPVICLAHGPPLFTCHRFRPLLPPLDPLALPFYFSFIAGLPQFQLRNALVLATGRNYENQGLRYLDLCFIRSVTSQRRQHQFRTGSFQVFQLEFWKARFVEICRYYFIRFGH